MLTAIYRSAMIKMRIACNYWADDNNNFDDDDHDTQANCKFAWLQYAHMLISAMAVAMLMMTANGDDNSDHEKMAR